MTNEFLKVQLLHFMGVVDKFSHLCQIYSQVTVPKIYLSLFLTELSKKRRRLFPT